MSPVTEELRVAALRGLELLDTPPEQRFDRVTRLAQQLFAVPIATINLIDSNRQWRKSVQGALPQETPRTGSPCELTLADANTVVIEDAISDERLSSNPYVVGDPGLRFYAGRRLLAPGGEPIGTFCIMDLKPRPMTDVEVETLGDLAGWVQGELVRSQEMDSAGAVQRGLLPKRTPDIEGWELAGLCVQARGVGGDFYDWYPTPDGCWQFTMADVMGKGMGAALIAATTRALLRGTASSIDLADGFQRSSMLLDLDLSESGTFVTLLHGRFDPTSGLLTYVDAGHGLAMHIRADGSWVHLPSSSLPVGVDSAETWPARSLLLEPGDAFVCGSDGLLEIYDDVQGGIAAMVGAVATSAEEMVQLVADQAEGDHLLDDVSTLVIRRQP